MLLNRNLSFLLSFTNKALTDTTHLYKDDLEKFKVEYKPLESKTNLELASEYTWVLISSSRSREKSMSVWNSLYPRVYKKHREPLKSRLRNSDLSLREIKSVRKTYFIAKQLDGIDFKSLYFSSLSSVYRLPDIDRSMAERLWRNLGNDLYTKSGHIKSLARFLSVDVKEMMYFLRNRYEISYAVIDFCLWSYLKKLKSEDEFKVHEFQRYTVKEEILTYLRDVQYVTDRVFSIGNMADE